MIISDEKGIRHHQEVLINLNRPDLVSKANKSKQAPRKPIKDLKLSIPGCTSYALDINQKTSDNCVENKDEGGISGKYYFKAFSKKESSASIIQGNSMSYDFCAFSSTTTPRANEVSKGNPDTSMDDESLNENKEHIHPMMLKNQLNTKVLTAGKNLQFTNKLTSLEANRNHLSISAPKSQCSVSNSRKNSTQSSNVPVETFRSNKIAGPKALYPLTSPIPPVQRFSPEADLMLGEAILGPKEQMEYENLEITQRVPIITSKSMTFEVKELKSKATGLMRKPTKAVTDPKNVNKKTLLPRESLISCSLGKMNRKSLSIAKENDPKGFITLADLEEKNYSDILLKAIFNHDLPIIKKILRRREFPVDVNTPDALGNTPLMLATKLSYRHPDYLEIVKCLLSYGADPKIKDGSGWSCLDEAVSQADSHLLSILFDGLTELKAKTLTKQKDDLLKLLEDTPNFYLEMKWDFESSLIPFISKLAPSDTFRIWKFGKYIRMDYTLTGFKRLTAKRRNMSILFNTHIEVPEGYSTCAPLFSLNREKNIYTNILQHVEPDEKRLLVDDLLKAEPIQGNFDIKSCTWAENKSVGFFGSPKACKINEWITKKFDFKLTLEYALFKKSKILFRDVHESYVNGLKNALTASAKTDLERKDNDILSQIKHINELNPDRLKKEKTSQIIENDDTSEQESMTLKKWSSAKLNIETFENTQVSEKKSSASLWVAPNFPINIKSFLPVLEFLSKGNTLLQKLELLLSREDLKPVLKEDAFPVKLQVPLSMSVKANVTMMTCKPLENPNIKDLFFLPNGYKYVNRRDAQKTLLRSKKRMILINTLI